MLEGKIRFELKGKQACRLNGRMEGAGSCCCCYRSVIYETRADDQYILTMKRQPEAATRPRGSKRERSHLMLQMNNEWKCWEKNCSKSPQAPATWSRSSPKASNPIHSTPLDTHSRTQLRDFAKRERDKKASSLPFSLSLCLSRSVSFFLSFVINPPDKTG